MAQKHRMIRLAKGRALGALRAAALMSVAACSGSSNSASGHAEPLSAAERARMPGIITFVSERAAHKDVWLVRPTGEEEQLTSSPQDEYPAAAAPDGTSILVVAAWQAGEAQREQLRLVPLAGGPAVPLHPPRGRARNPSWAPDGTWLVAESDERGFSDIVRAAPRLGAEPLWLTSAPEGNFEPSVSPDGRHVAFVSSRDGDPEIYITTADGTDIRRLTAFHREDWAPQWSPDGRWIAFSSNREGRARVFVVRPDGTGVRAVSGTASTGEERDIAWSPDSRTLAFVGRQSDGTTRIWTVAAEGGNPVALTPGTSLDAQPAWSPDGRYLVFVSERTGDAELFLMRADGSGATQLTRSAGADWLPRWLAAR